MGKELTFTGSSGPRGGVSTVSNDFLQSGLLAEESHCEDDHAVPVWAVDEKHEMNSKIKKALKIPFVWHFVL